MLDYPRHSLRIMRAACSDPLGAPNATVRVGGALQIASKHPEQTRTNLNNSERRPTPRPDRNARQITQNTLHQNFYGGWMTESGVAAGLARVEQFTGRLERLSG